MITEQERYFSPIIFFFDCLAILIAYGLGVRVYTKLLYAVDTFFVMFGSHPNLFFYWDRYLLTLPFFFMLFVFFYEFWYQHRVLQLRKIRAMMVQVAAPCLLTGFIFAVFTIVNHSFRADVWFVAIFVSLSWIFLMINRICVLLYLGREKKKGNFIKYLLVCGHRRAGMESGEAL